MVQAEAEVRVACRWCGFFSKPASACDVCGSPLPTNAPQVPLEVARAAVFSRADPISILDERERPDVSPASAWDRLIDVLGGPERPRPRVVIELDEIDQSGRDFPDEVLYSDSTDLGPRPDDEAFLDQLATGPPVPELAPAPVAHRSEALPRVEAFVEFDAEDALVGPLFGLEIRPSRVPPAPAWSALAPPIRPAIRITPAWSAEAPVRAKTHAMPAWSADAPPLMPRALSPRPMPAWSAPAPPVRRRIATAATPAWSAPAPPVPPVRVLTTTVPVPAWSTPAPPLRANPVPIPPAPAWSILAPPLRVGAVRVPPAQAWSLGGAPRRLPVDPPALTPAWASAAFPIRVLPTPAPVTPAWATPAPPARPRRSPAPEPPPLAQPAATEPPPLREAAPGRRAEIAGELSALAAGSDVAADPAPAPRPAPRPVLERPPGPGGPPPSLPTSPEVFAGPTTARTPLRAVPSPPIDSAPPAADPTANPRRRRLLRRGAAPEAVPTPAPPSEARPRRPDRLAPSPPPAAAAPVAEAQPNGKPVTGGMTCSRCGRLGERALCEACRDALQELHALSLG
jgi:hypothetical protein